VSIFERYLSVWVFLCIVVGIACGQLLPGAFQLIGGLSVAQVNLPVGILIWIMIIPMLVKVDFGALGQIRRHVKGIGVTLFVNWLVKPFSMALLGWIFIRHLFAVWLPVDQLDSYIAGLILLAAAPCTAMVFVWSRLTNGDPLFTLSQVAQRHDHGGCLCTAGRAATWHFRDHSAVGYAAHVRGVVHRHSGPDCPGLAKIPPARGYCGF
jgi:arsenite transporter